MIVFKLGKILGKFLGLTHLAKLMSQENEYGCISLTEIEILKIFLRKSKMWVLQGVKERKK